MLVVFVRNMKHGHLSFREAYKKREKTFKRVFDQASAEIGPGLKSQSALGALSALQQALQSVLVTPSTDDQTYQFARLVNSTAGVIGDALRGEQLLVQKNLQTGGTSKAQAGQLFCSFLSSDLEKESCREWAGVPPPTCPHCDVPPLPMEGFLHPVAEEELNQLALQGTLQMISQYFTDEYEEARKKVVIKHQEFFVNHAGFDATLVDSVCKSFDTGPSCDTMVLGLTGDMSSFEHELSDQKRQAQTNRLESKFQQELNATNALINQTREEILEHVSGVVANSTAELRAEMQELGSNLTLEMQELGSNLTLEMNAMEDRLSKEAQQNKAEVLSSIEESRVALSNQMDGISSQIDTMGNKTLQALNQAKAELAADIADVKDTVVAQGDRIVQDLQHGFNDMSSQVQSFEASFNKEMAGMQRRDAIMTDLLVGNSMRVDELHAKVESVVELSEEHELESVQLLMSKAMLGVKSAFATAFDLIEQVQQAKVKQSQALRAYTQCEVPWSAVEVEDRTLNMSKSLLDPKQILELQVQARDSFAVASRILAEGRYIRRMAEKAITDIPAERFHNASNFSSPMGVSVCRNMLSPQAMQFVSRALHDAVTKSLESISSNLERTFELLRATFMLTKGQGIPGIAFTPETKNMISQAGLQTVFEHA